MCIVGSTRCSRGVHFSTSHHLPFPTSTSPRCAGPAPFRGGQPSLCTLVMLVQKPGVSTQVFFVVVDTPTPPRPGPPRPAVSLALPHAPTDRARLPRASLLRRRGDLTQRLRPSLPTLW